MFNQLHLPYLLESSIILALGYIIYRLLFASDKAYIRNRIYLLSVLLLSFLLPLIVLPVYAQHIVTPIERADVMLTSSTSRIVETSSFDWSTIMFSIYIGVAIVLSFRLVYHIVYITKIIRKSDRITVNGVQHIITDNLATPASIFNFLLSNNIDLPLAVIDHEKVHMRHGHTWDVLVMELAKILLWFNPFVYLISRALKENHEYIADYLAANSLEDELEYSSILLQYAKSNQAPILLNTFSTITKKRIIMLSKKSTNNSWKVFLMIPILCVFVSLFSCESYQVEVSSDDDISAESMSDIRIDTVMTWNEERQEQISQIEKVYINDIRTWIDTTYIFDSETFEEKVQIVKSESPRTEILRQTYTTNEYNKRTGDLESKTYHRYPQEMVAATDTMVTFDYDTYEEQVTIMKVERPREELVSTKITPKDRIKKEQKFDNTFELENKVIIKSKGN